MNDRPEIRNQPVAGKLGYHHGDLRAQLVEATRQLVEEKGPDLFSVSEACRVAGVSTAAPYKHFRDKAEMLDAVAFEGMQRKHARMLAALDACTEERHARIVALGRVYLEFACDEPGVFRLIFGFSHARSRCAALDEKGQANYVLLETEVMRQRGSDSIGPEERRRAFLLWSFVHGLAFLMIDGKADASEPGQAPEELLAEIARRVMEDGPS